MMIIELLNNKYEVIDTIEKITIADSFVVPKNKIGTGNGEAKLYIGHNSDRLRSFFGSSGFYNRCFLLKKDLIKYLEDIKVEYIYPQQLYNYKTQLPEIWNLRYNKIKQLPERIEFVVEEQTQIDGPRVYIKSSDLGYKLIRELSLPHITYISIIKLKNLIDNSIEYYYKFFTDYFGEIDHPNVVQQEFQQSESNIISQDRTTIIKARVGQGKYREKLLELCPCCPITEITDNRILIASHIKPWSHSNDKEKVDPYNGFMFTPTYDYLFDRGFISFTNDKKIILSPFLSKTTYSKLDLFPNKLFPLLPIDDREEYLEYHRNEILK